MAPCRTGIRPVEPAVGGVIGVPASDMLFPAYLVKPVGIARISKQFGYLQCYSVTFRLPWNEDNRCLIPNPWLLLSGSVAFPSTMNRGVTVPTEVGPYSKPDQYSPRLSGCRPLLATTNHDLSDPDSIPAYAPGKRRFQSVSRNLSLSENQKHQPRAPLDNRNGLPVMPFRPAVTWCIVCRQTRCQAVFRRKTVICPGIQNT